MKRERVRGLTVGAAPGGPSGRPGSHHPAGSSGGHTRAGGRSAGPYESFNLGDLVGDDPAAVAANRGPAGRRAGAAGDHLVWMEQVHGRTVTDVDRPPDAR